MKKPFFSGKIFAEFDAFITQETLVPFEGLIGTFYVVESHLMMKSTCLFCCSNYSKIVELSFIPMATKSGCLLDEILELEKMMIFKGSKPTKT